MAKGIVTPELIEQLKAIVGEKFVYTDKDKLEPYSHDEVTDPHYMKEPQVVVLPANTEEVAKVVKLCYDNDTVMVPRAAGTGLAAGAVATFGGVIISIERMNKILEIDKQNMVCVTEPGVTTAVLQEEVQKEGLFYGGDPCSGDSCFIGGNVATNAGGNKAVKYGTTRNQIYGMKIVTPTGDIVDVGARLQKCSTGYCLEQLICGSEGTLGVVTEITLKLRPLPPYKFDLVAIFNEDAKAFALPNKILKAGIEPTSIEYMDNKALKMCSNFCKVTLPHVEENCCYVIITVESFDEDELDKKMEKISDLCDDMGAVDVIQADDRIWGCRRQFAEAARDIDIMFVAEDFVVPLDKIAEITAEVPGLEEKHGIYTVTSAHIGDGNIHVLPLNKDGLSPEDWMKKMAGFHEDLFEKVYALGGKMSGEHGIGYKKLVDFKRCTPPGEYKMIRAIKKALDPNDILNPAKIVDLEDSI